MKFRDAFEEKQTRRAAYMLLFGLFGTIGLTFIL